MMKRAKGATLAEIVAATGWQKHTVRGFVSILGSKGGQQIESSRTPPGTAATESQSSTAASPPFLPTPFPVPIGGRFFCGGSATVSRAGASETSDVTDRSHHASRIAPLRSRFLIW